MYSGKRGVFGVLALQATNGGALRGPKGLGFFTFSWGFGCFFWELIGKSIYFRQKTTVFPVRKPCLFLSVQSTLACR